MTLGELTQALKKSNPQWREVTATRNVQNNVIRVMIDTGARTFTIEGRRPEDFLEHMNTLQRRIDNARKADINVPIFPPPIFLKAINK